MIGTVAASRLHPLLTEAELCLLASSVPHTGTDPWTNRGTGGTALDGQVVTNATYLPTGQTATIADATTVSGPALYTTHTPPPMTPLNVPYSARMFDIPADITDHELDDGEGTESFAITIVLTPLHDLTLHPTPSGIRFLWNYEDDGIDDPKNLLSSEYGAVIENITAIPNPDPPPTDLEGDWLAAAASYGIGEVGVDVKVVGNIEDRFPAGRQAITLRVDRGEHLVTVWRNGAGIADPDGNGDLTGIGQLLDSTNPVKIGGGHACHAVIWHKRLLTDAEVEDLHGLFV